MIRKGYGKITCGVVAMILCTDILESAAEFLFKTAAMHTGITNVTVHNLGIFIGRIIFALPTWLGVIVSVINFLLWITVLARVDLSIAFPLGSATYVIVAVVSSVFLHEQIHLLRWVGIFLIITGVSYMYASAKTRA